MMKSSLLPFIAVFLVLGGFALAMERRMEFQSHKARIILVGESGVDDHWGGLSPLADSISAAATKMQDQGDQVGAAAMLANFASSAPDSLSGRIWFQVGQLYLQAEEDSLALLAFTNASRSPSPPRDAGLWLAITQKGAGTEGIEALTKFLLESPGYAPGWYRLGRLQQKAGDVDGAVTSWKKSLEIFPGYKEPKYSLSLANIHRQQWKEAVQGLTDLVRAYPWKPEYHYQLAKTLAATGKHKDALAEYHRSIARRGGNYPEAWAGMAMLFRSMNLEDSARTAFEKAISLRPNSPETLYNLGLQFLSTNMLDSAANMFQRAAKIKPTYKEAWYNLGVVLARRDLDDSAISAYSRALSIDPTYMKARLGLAIRLEGLGRHAQALSAYRQGLAQDSTDAELWFGTGLVLRRMDSLPEAIVAYQKSLALAPDNDKAINNLGISLALQGNRKQAAEVLRQGMSRFPDNVSIRYNLAIQESKLGGTQEAVALLKSVHTLQPRHVGAVRMLGDILAAQGKKMEASDLYRTFLALEPGDVDVRKALAALGSP